MAFSDGSSVPLALHAERERERERERECFAARGLPCRGDSGERLLEGEARASHRREGLRLRSARRIAPGAGHRDDRPTQEEPKEEKDPGRAQAEALQEEMEDREAVRLASKLQEAGGSLRVQGPELPGHGPVRVHRHPAQEMFMRWLLVINPSCPLSR